MMDLAALWDFSDPVLSEQRLRVLLDTVSGDDALIVQTQIARSFGLRQDFVQAQQLLRQIELALPQAGTEVQVRHALEYGRTLSSATHDPQTQTETVKATARSAYMQAFTIARAEQLDDLAIDALHMLAFVDSDPADQLKWGLQALAVAEQSSQLSAKRWEGSLRNNIGYALHQLGRFAEALEQFQQAVTFRERNGTTEQIRVAYWMVAWTLRALNRNDEALAIQVQLKEECEAAGTPDPYVLEEIALLRGSV
jgi:tetratricopeptide (TPR) repeat protein